MRRIKQAIRLDEEKIKAQGGWCERAFVLSAWRASRLPNEAFSCPKIKTDQNSVFAILPRRKPVLLAEWSEAPEGPGSDTSVERSIFASKTSWPKRHLASCRCFCKPYSSVNESENGCQLPGLQMYCTIKEHVAITVRGMCTVENLDRARHFSRTKAHRCGEHMIITRDDVK